MCEYRLFAQNTQTSSPRWANTLSFTKDQIEPSACKAIVLWNSWDRSQIFLIGSLERSPVCVCVTSIVRAALCIKLRSSWSPPILSSVARRLIWLSPAHRGPGWEERLRTLPPLWTCAAELQICTHTQTLSSFGGIFQVELCRWRVACCQFSNLSRKLFLSRCPIDFYFRGNWQMLSIELNLYLSQNIL